VFRSLRPSFGGEVETSPFVRRCYTVAAGIYAQRPRAVAFPAGEGDVRAAVEFCRRARLPLTARGAGSGMAGNNVGRGLVLDFTRHLNRVLAFEPGTGEVVTEPGATYDGLNEFLRPHRRFLPPNPSSGAFCTLGGMVANNASGMRSVKYGSIAPWLAGARGVWGTGEAFDLRRPGAADGPDPGGLDRVLARLESLFREALPPPPSWLPGVVKNSSGLRVWPAWDGSRLDGVELLASSEGTLAIFTELTFRTARLPGGRALLLAAFANLDELDRAVELLRSLDPSGVEFLDGTFLEPLRAGNPSARAALPSEAEAVLFVELEGKTQDAAAEVGHEALDRLAGLSLPGARLAEGEEESRSLWSLRRGASPSLARRHPRRVPLQFVEDCAVPPGRLPELLRGLRRIFADEGVPVVLFGHAGESHVHANPLLEPDDPHLAARVERLAGEVCDLVERLEGTLSGEHGDGLARAAFTARRFGAGAGFFAAVKRVCDPQGILNPGKILPLAGWRTGRDLRHPWERRALAGRRRRPGGRVALPESGPPRRRRG
jgi:FAD/FMN-containing dehydrogenase